VIEKIKALSSALAGIITRPALDERVDARGVYTFECRDKDGNLRWREDIRNLVTTAGKNDLLDKYFAGSSYTAAWYLGLVNYDGSAPTYAVTDTMTSHAGWTENTSYSNSTRVAASWGAAASGSKATSAASFNINATATIAGAFLTTGSAKSGTAGILYSCGSFAANRTVYNGDTLEVTYTASV
jgi:hypothetical protein